MLGVITDINGEFVTITPINGLPWVIGYLSGYDVGDVVSITIDPILEVATIQKVWQQLPANK